MSDGRKSCAKRPMWNCLLHTSMGVFLIEICDTSHWRLDMSDEETKGDWIAQKLVHHIEKINGMAGAEVIDQVITDSAGDCTFTVQSGTALGRNGLRNWFECTITFGCAVNEVTRNMRTCICPQWRLIRSKKQQVTLVWRMTQISKLKAGGQCAGHCPSLG